MPLRDGMGPLGLGPGSGRGRGRCRAGSGYRSIPRLLFHGRQGWLLGMAVPLVTAVLRDLLNPSGVLHRIVHASLRKKITENARKTVREAECTVSDENSDPLLQKKDAIE